MGLSKELVLRQLDEFIAAGTAIKVIQPSNGKIGSYDKVDNGELAEWKLLGLAIVGDVVPRDHPLRDEFRSLLGVDPRNLPYCIAAFRGLRRAVESGLLTSIETAIREAISADDLSLAEAFLSDHAAPDRSHIAAAVVAGATLERAARAKCASLGIDRKPSGEPKALNALIDALKGAGAITALRDKQMRPWVDIRNAAAHGDFDKFTRQDVEAFMRDLPAVLAEIR